MDYINRAVAGRKKINIKVVGLMVGAAFLYPLFFLEPIEAFKIMSIVAWDICLENEIDQLLKEL